jgi:histone deacetylase 6
VGDLASEPPVPSRCVPAGRKDDVAVTTGLVYSLARGRAVLVLEGGYNLEAISAAAAACTAVLLGDPLASLDPGPPNIVAERVLRQVLETQRPFWPAL